ncbi:MAG: PDZ domain-containing protein [Planctomycetales bacterium]|nr:PDZ domain-containing protein [Planctomycetales bacterium]
MKRQLAIASIFISLTLAAPRITVCWADDPPAAEKPEAKPADEADEESPDEVERERGRSLAQSWLDRIRNFTRGNPHEKNSDGIKAVFKEVVADTAQATVLVFAGDEPKAYGAIVAQDGFVLTKASEVMEAEEISCRLKDGRHLSATVVGVHDDSDLAMLKIDAHDLPVVAWRDDPPPVGSWLATTGIDDAPLALGVMSVKPRKIRPQPGVLGVSLEDADKGPRISEVMRRSAAQKAGLQKDDVVLTIDGKQVKNRQAMIGTIQKRKPGDEVKL